MTVPTDVRCGKYAILIDLDGNKVYDSGLPKKCWDATLPIGNTTRTYKEILRDWNFGDKLWHFLSWNTSREPYLHIQVDENFGKAVPAES